MKVKFHRTVQNTTNYTYRKPNTSRDTLSSRDPCCRQRFKDARSVSLYPYNRSQILKYVKYTKKNIVKGIANFCDK